MIEYQRTTPTGQPLRLQVVWIGPDGQPAPPELEAVLERLQQQAFTLPFLPCFKGIKDPLRLYRRTLTWTELVDVDPCVPGDLPPNKPTS